MHIPRDPKWLAQNLRKALAERKIQVSHSDSLEYVARQFGWRDWNTLAAQLGRPTLRMPEHWNVGGSRPGDYEMGYDPEENCALIRYANKHSAPAVDHRGSGFGTLMQQFRADTYLAKRLQLRAQLRSQDVIGAVTLWLRIDSDKGRILAFDNMESRVSNGPLTGTVDWTDRAIVLDVPSEASSIHFGFYLRGCGSAWARSFALHEVDVSIPVTDVIPPRRDAPANLDFAAVA